MTADGARFETDVQGIWGNWPSTPGMWSYSSLTEMEACPRRWMLARATYPELWDQRGYPPLPTVAALFGNVVHGVVERLTRALSDASTEGELSGVVWVLGGLGGWRKIVAEEVEHQLARFDDNPRVSTERIDRIREELLRRAPQAADQTKVFLGRTAVPTDSRRLLVNTVEHKDGPPRSLPATPGVHAEREVRAEELRLTGRIDLLIIDDVDVTIVDFKTGEEIDSHEDQVRLYALLWGLDTASNPDHRPATKLEIAYPSYARAVEPLDQAGLIALKTSTASRIAAAEVNTRDANPVAMPSPSMCQFCPVRHLCDAYWTSIPPAVPMATTEEWFDFEGRVLAPHGNRSWFFECNDATAQVLVRTAEPNVAFPLGGRVRLLGVRRIIDPDYEGRRVISMVNTSEWYPVSS